ncbi:MAG: hypothetical protein ACT4P3_07310 [Betaproteobacteria bacterium]
MTEAERLLRRQSLWQKRRQGLSWPEKVRIAEQVRPALERWHAGAGKPASMRRGER